MKPILFKRPAGLLPEEELAAELVMKVFPDAGSAAMMLEVLQDFNSNRPRAQQAVPVRGVPACSGPGQRAKDPAPSLFLGMEIGCFFEDPVLKLTENN